MSRRALLALALFISGLMVGLIVSRFLLPDHFGILTMLGLLVIGIVLGGVVVGLVGRRSLSGAGAAQPLNWEWHIGSRRFVVRTDSMWWERFQTQRLGITAETRVQGWRGLWDAHWAQIQVPAAGVLVGAFVVAALAQLLIVGQQLVPGLVLYAVVLLVLIAWSLLFRVSLFNLVSVARIGRRAEIVLLVLVLLVAFGARLIQAGPNPVGIDGDELKWTAQTYFDQVTHEAAGDFSGQAQFTPISFLVDRIAFDFWGVNFDSPRIMTALLSALATILFYFVARDMFNVGVALVATLLMATSFFDISASRQAIVETFTKLPSILALFLVIRGIDRQRWFYFLLLGFTLYVGMMTYDTFFVFPAIILIYMFYRAALGWRTWYRWILYFALVIAPMLLTYSVVLDTINGRQSFYLKGVGIGVAQFLSPEALAPMVTNTLRIFQTLFQSVYAVDYALNWSGPLVNPLMLPLLVIGLGLVLARFWQRHNLLLVLAFLLTFFPAPILSGYYVPRVLYLGLAPIFIFAAVGLAAFAALLLSLSRERPQVARYVAAGALVVLVLIAVSDLFIYTRELQNQDDWLQRRAFVNTVTNSVRSAPLTFFPVTRSDQDFVYGNSNPISFLVYAALKDADVNKYFKVLGFDELPGALAAAASHDSEVNIVYDPGMAQDQKIAQQTIDTIKHCYAGVKSRTGSFFTTYTVPQAALADPACYSVNQLQGSTPNDQAPVPADSPVTFQWQTDTDRPPSYDVVVEQRSPDLVYLEGESFPLDNNWAFEAKADYYPGFSGKGYILDNQGAGTTELDATIPTDGNYNVWVRSLRAFKEGHRSFVTVGDQKFEFARPDVSLMTWNWEKVGQVDLKAGTTPVTLSRVFQSDDWKPILVDSIALSSDPSYDPNTSQLWATIADSGVTTSTDRQYVLESGLKPGNYRWRVELLDGDKLVDAQGKKGIWSGYNEFVVQ